MNRGLFGAPPERLGPLDPPLGLGTSSWSSADWKGSFYPQEARPGDFLAHYARQFDTVECDATFYGVPAPRTVDGWVARTPVGFLLSAKLPREITHELGMVDCAELLGEFLGHHREMDALVARLPAEGGRRGDWSELAIDRSEEMRAWVAPLKARATAGARVLVYFNNHYAGYAPGSVFRFGRLWMGDQSS